MKNEWVFTFQVAVIYRADYSKPLICNNSVVVTFWKGLRYPSLGTGPEGGKENVLKGEWKGRRRGTGFMETKRSSLE